MSLKRERAPADVSASPHCPPHNLGRIFVGGLNKASTDDASLQTFFAQFGELSDVYVARSSDTARARGFGFVTYADPEVANRVAAMTKLRLDGKQVEVKMAGEPASSPQKKRPDSDFDPFKIYVGGLQAVAHTAGVLQSYFEQYGAVLSVSLVRDQKTGHPRGFAFIEFVEPAAAEKALSGKAKSKPAHHHVADRLVWVTRVKERQDEKIRQTSQNPSIVCPSPTGPFGSAGFETGFIPCIPQTVDPAKRQCVAQADMAGMNVIVALDRLMANLQEQLATK